MPAAPNAPRISPTDTSASVPELLDVIEQQAHVIAERNRLIAEQQKLLALMEEQLRLARQRRFGSSSEKQPHQGDFFDEAELEVALSEVEAQLPDATPSKPKRKPRAGFSDKLPRIRIDLPLSDDEKAGATSTFFSKVKEELDIVPAQARVLEYWQEKAVFEADDGAQTFKAAARPLHPLGKCIASVPLLAYILVA